LRTFTEGCATVDFEFQGGVRRPAVRAPGRAVERPPVQPAHLAHLSHRTRDERHGRRRRARPFPSACARRRRPKGSRAMSASIPSTRATAMPRRVGRGIAAAV